MAAAPRLATLALALQGGLALPPSQGQPCLEPDRAVAIPLNDLGTSVYVRMDGQATSYQGGLYPDGSNQRPEAHQAAGLALASAVTPLGPDGQADPDQGRIAVVSLGMSNTEAEFQTFMDLVHGDPEVNPRVVLVNGAQGGRTADRWVDPASPTYDEVDRRLASRELTPAQVQVFWIKQTLTRGGNFPEKALSLEADLKAIVRNLAARYPNLQLVFLSSRTRSYTYGRGLSPEPVAFETGFAVKWLIEAQIEGDPDLNYDPTRGAVVAPYLAWGPYLWIDGQTPRSDGMTWTADDLASDCTHPSQQGAAKVAEMLRTFFLSDSLTSSWFGQAEPIPTSEPVVAASATPRPSPSPASTTVSTATAGPMVEPAATGESGSSTPAFPAAGAGAFVVLAGLAGVAGVIALRRRR